MGFSRNRPRSRKYGADHARQRAEHMADLARVGGGRCAELVCVKPSRWIHASMGPKLHLCHDRPTGRVLGLGHAECNQAEAARYARSLQGPTAAPTPSRPRPTGVSPLRF